MIKAGEVFTMQKHRMYLKPEPIALSHYINKLDLWAKIQLVFGWGKPKQMGIHIWMQVEVIDGAPRCTDQKVVTSLFEGPKDPYQG